MLAKCITPTCDSQFKYFGRGILLMKKIEMKDGHLSADAELFWMCDECVRKSLAPPQFVALSRPASQEKVRTESLAA